MTLTDLRERIDCIDNEIVDCLGARFEIVREVARSKHQSATAVMQPGRVEEVRARCRARGEQHGLSVEFVDALYKLIIDEACRVEYAAFTATV